MTRFKLTLILSLAAILTFAQEENPNAVDIQTIQDKVWVIKGPGGNVGVLETGEGLVLVDDLFERHGENIIAALKGVSEDKVKYVINTHFHYDHSDGNKSLGKVATLIGHDNTYIRLNKDNTITLPGRDPHLQEKFPEHALPEITFADKMKLQSGDQTVSLHHLQSGHTDTDVVVKFEEANVLHTGDSFVRYGIPFMDVDNGGSYSGFIKGLEAIISLCDENTQVIPGHGVVCTVKEVEVLHKDLKFVFDTVAKETKNGKSATQILEANLFEGMFEGSFIPISVLVGFVVEEIE